MQVAGPRDPQVLEALRDFQERLVLPQDERLSGCNLYNRCVGWWVEWRYGSA
jgi:hypothetical protein